MAGEYIPQALRRQVWTDAGNRCGYCLTAQNLLPEPLFIEHIRARALGGFASGEFPP
jgi:hypothetical protein